MRCLLAGFLLAALGVGPTNTSAQESGGFTATYRLTFEATWSQDTHPDGFPSNPHFSPLIGATHDDQGRLWRFGDIASDGIEGMAEVGATGGLQAEAIALQGLGIVDGIVSGGGIGRSPGMVEVVFTARRTHSLLSITSMLAPSPDWFVGVDSVDLQQDGQWRDSVTEDLYLYDAGTDSGSSYTASNADTQPPNPITRVTDGPFADGLPVGQLRLRLLSTSGAPPISNDHSGLYFDPERPGEGFNVVIGDVEDRQVLAINWYTYNAGLQLYLVGNVDLEPEQAMLTVPLFTTDGASFGEAFDPEAVNIIPWGEVTLTFPACGELAIVWESEDFGSGEMSLEKLLGGREAGCT